MTLCYKHQHLQQLSTHFRLDFSKGEHDKRGAFSVEAAQQQHLLHTLCAPLCQIQPICMGKLGHFGWRKRCRMIPQGRLQNT